MRFGVRPAELGAAPAARQQLSRCHGHVSVLRAAGGFRRRRAGLDPPAVPSGRIDWRAEASGIRETVLHAARRAALPGDPAATVAAGVDSIVSRTDCNVDASAHLFCERISDLRRRVSDALERSHWGAALFQKLAWIHR